MFNKNKMSPTTYNYRRTKAMGLLKFSLVLAHQQINRGIFFILEHPASASSLSSSTVRDFSLRHPSVVNISFDQCRFGLKNPDGSRPIEQQTTFMIKSPKLACECFRTCVACVQCSTRSSKVHAAEQARHCRHLPTLSSRIVSTHCPCRQA